MKMRMPPLVSVVMPCRNEERTIGDALRSLLVQTIGIGQLEVVVVDSQSTDGTAAVVRSFADEHPEASILLLQNPRETIPSSLNTGLAAATGEFIVRLDAHAQPAPDYIERCITALQAGRGDNVGGLWEIRPGAQSCVAAGIAAAAQHPVGAGDAAYRVGGKARAVDTVPFGAFRRDLFTRIATFDERLLTNEDYELNARIRRSGGVIWFDPDIKVAYFARSTLGALAQQYWRYGYWKRQMLRRDPRSVRLRQVIPPAFTLLLTSLGLAAIAVAAIRPILLALIAMYFAALLGAGAQSAFRRRSWKLVFCTLPAFVTIHAAWSLGFLTALISREAA